MSDWADLFRRQNDHEQYHATNRYLASIIIQARVPDQSCFVCFPDHYPFEQSWYFFRRWFFQQFPVLSHCGTSRRQWNRIQSVVPHIPFTNRYYPGAIEQLLVTFRFRALSPPPAHIVEVILTAFQVYQGFHLDPDPIGPEPQLAEPQTRALLNNSESSEDSEREPEQELEQPDTPPDARTDSDTTDDPDVDNMEAGGDIPDLDAGGDDGGEQVPPEMNELVEVLRSLKNKRTPLTNKPFRGYSQDPAEWVQEYEIAVNALGWDDEAMFRAAPSYLRDAALTWFQEHADNFLRWDTTNEHPRRAEALRPSLITAFRTAGNVRQWQLELNRRVQKKDETVEQYATGFQKLLKKVDPNRNIPEGSRCHMFLRGLAPSLQFQLQTYLTCRDEITFQGIVTAAQQYEQA